MSARELTPEAHKTIAEKMDDLIAFAALYGVIVDVKFRYPKGTKPKAPKTKVCPSCGGAPDHVECPICGAPAGEGCCAGDPDRCFGSNRDEGDR